MKPWRMGLWVALAALVVGLAAAPAWAVKPTANNDGQTLAEEAKNVMIPVLSNDAGYTVAANFVQIVDTSNHVARGCIDSIGAFNGANPGVIFYTPDSNFWGSASFSYRVHGTLGDYDTALVTLTVTSDGSLLDARFVWTPTMIFAGDVVTFNDTTTELTRKFCPSAWQGNTWLWDFGTDTVGGVVDDTSNLPNPAFTFSSPGIYTVTLVVGSESNNSTEKDSVVHQIAVGSRSATAYFATNGDLTMDLIAVLSPLCDTPHVVSKNFTDSVVMIMRFMNAGASSDRITNIRLRSRNSLTNSISRLAIYRESGDVDSVSHQGSFNKLQDQLVNQSFSPGAFDWGPPGNLNGLYFDFSIPQAAGTIDPAGPLSDTVIYYVVMDGNLAIDENWHNGQMGVALNGAGLTAEAITTLNHGVGPRIVLNGAVLIMTNGPDSTMNGNTVEGAGCLTQPLRFDLAPPEATIAFDWSNICLIGCEESPPTDSAISLGDSIRICVTIAGGDTNQIAAGWPKVHVIGVGIPDGTLMHRKSNSQWCFPDTGVAGPADDYFMIPYSVPDPIDVNAGFWKVIVETRDLAGNLGWDTLEVNIPVDTRKPALPPDSIAVTKVFDYEGEDGWVGVNDVLKFYIDLRNNPIVSNPPGSKEICQVYAVLYGWYNTPRVVMLVDSANDNRWKGYDTVDAGILQTPPNPGALALDSIRFIISDNACNIDSVNGHLAANVDNVRPDLLTATVIYEKVVDRDSNNCLGVGLPTGFAGALADVVRIRVSGVSLDIDTLYADLLTAGIGGEAPTLPKVARYKLTPRGAGIFEDTLFLKGDTLKKVAHPYPTLPLDPSDTIYTTIDGVDSVKIFGRDDSFNWSDTIYAGPIDQAVDTRRPKPVRNLTCARDTTPAGSQRFILTWKIDTLSELDNQKYLIFWDEGGESGNPNHTSDTLAAVFDTSTSKYDTMYTWSTDSTVVSSRCRSYTFEVRAIDDCGNWDPVGAKTTCEHPTPPAVKLDSQPAPVSGCNYLTLRWNQGDPSVKEYYIYWDGFDADTLVDALPIDTVQPGPTTRSWSIYDSQLRGYKLKPDSIYRFEVRSADTCGHTSAAIKWRYTVPRIEHMTWANPACSSQVGGDIQLKWYLGNRPPRVTWPSYYVVMWSLDGDDDPTLYPLDTVMYHTLSGGLDTAAFYWSTKEASAAALARFGLVDKAWYKFNVFTYDSCGFMEGVHTDTIECRSDLAPAYSCVFQPPPGTLNCDSTGLTIYACPLDPLLDDDVVSVVAWGRIADISSLSGIQPGDWFQIGAASQSPQDVCFRIPLNAATLNSEVGADTSKKIEVAITTLDWSGKTLTPDSAWVHCPTQYWFNWSTEVVAGEVISVNGRIQTEQTYCGLRGFEAWGPVNPVVLGFSDTGIPPYTIQVLVDSMEYLYKEGVTTSYSFNLDVTGFAKGAHKMQVFWWDFCGHVGSDVDTVCIPDSLAPCAIISNPVDGKCIRRSRSMLDKIDVCVQIDPIENCIDPDSVLKVDYQWALDCCVGDLVDTTWIGVWRSCNDTTGNGDNLVCDTAFDYYGPGLDSIICRDTTITPQCSVLVYVPVIDTTPCDNAPGHEWHTFAIQAGDSLYHGGVQAVQGEGGPGPQGGPAWGCAEWYNKDDLTNEILAEGGGMIYIRAIVYDEMGNKYITPCVHICVDTTIPPLCLWTPDECYGDGKTKLSGYVTFVADLDMDLANIDDLEDVVLYYKRSTDPDFFSSWHSLGSGFFGVGATPGGTNSTVWRWDSVNTNNFVDQVDYDFRVIAKTTTGLYSYDYNGNGEFDALTFDSTACDMNTYFIDNAAPEVAIDTVWTMINGEEVIQPNVSCAMSDPRGWAWAQYGQDLTVQPWVYPSAQVDDIARVIWTLYDGTNDTCSCQDTLQYVPSTPRFGQHGTAGFVLRINEGTHAYDKVTFNPADAPFASVTAGVQKMILHVEAYDSCGNYTDDCITLWLLDTDTTEAVIISPLEDKVFCWDGTGDGGIAVTAAGLLNEQANKVIFAYRAEGATDWIPFDSVGITSYDDTPNDFTVRWYPYALGLDDGAYELTCWAVDYSLNRQTRTWARRVYLDCSKPTVALTYPTENDPAFMGCPIELEATTTSSAINPVTQVDFYYQSVTSGTSTLIGTDYYTTDGTFHYHWYTGALTSLSGDYYIWAKATNKAGKTAESAKVWKRFDNTNPWAKVAQVGSDGSDGGSSDPTLIVAGETVTISAFARDNENSPPGYGPVYNCGVDSVLIYVYNSGGTLKMFGTYATPDQIIDSLFTASWNTTGWATGSYRVRAEVFDCACNSGQSSWWYVTITSPLAEVSLTVDGPVVCGYPSVDETAEFEVTVAEPLYMSSVYLYYLPPDISDLYDQYHDIGAAYDTVNNADGSRTFYFSEDVSEWTEGLYKFRVKFQRSDGTWLEDGDANGKFEDFTFNESFAHHMTVRVDHSVTAFTVTPDPGSTIKAHEDVCLNSDATEACDDVVDVHYGVAAGDYTFGENAALGEFCFDPLDSSGVTLNNCKSWSGNIWVTAYDVFGHYAAQSVALWILDVAGPDSVAITSPDFGEYVTPTNNTIEARKLSVSGVDSVQFWASTSATNGTLTYIGSSAASGDAFSTVWDLDSVAEGQYWLYGKGFDGGVGVDGPRCPATVAKGCVAFNLTAPNPSFQRTVNGQTFTYVGERTDLCVDRNGISSIVNGVGIDSIVWCFRNADVPGVTIEDNLDPNLGWVRIGADVYGSLCVDWFTNWCDTLKALYPEYGECCPDGRYTVVAWVYDKAGNACHSHPYDVMIDVTDPYSEIVDIDGDETFGTCHDIILPQDTVVKFTANAIDDHSCYGKQPWENSGAKYLQFFVGGCGAGGSVDVVWVVDGSGSMGDDQQAIADNAQMFVQGLGNSDYRLGVLAYTDTSAPVSTAGEFKTPGPGSGEFTTDPATFGTMVTAVGSDFGDGSTENGLRALMHAIEWYPWRQGAAKVLVLVTDENANQDLENLAGLLPALTNSGAYINTVINPGDSAGYSTLAPLTGGLTLDIGTSWGANLAALGSQIEAIASGNSNDVGIIWGKQVVLEDGQDNAYALWNPTGMPAGEYCAWTVAIDEVGNIYRSSSRRVCIIDKVPPEAFIAGFGESNAECDNCPEHTYWIYGRSCDKDVDYVQFQYRPEGSTNQAAWTGIGISTPIGVDTTGMWWKAPWNPCLLSGNFEMRVVPTDTNGNEDFEIQPILHVTISNCAIAIASASASDAEVWFEDQRFDNFGLVNVDLKTTSKQYNNFMMAVWADLRGDLTVEKIQMWVADPDAPDFIAGRFAGSDAVKLGGTGWFWEAYITGTGTSKVSHLKRADVNVWPLKADGQARCSKRNDLGVGAKVCLEPDALYEDNGVVTFPARIPTVNLSQQHYQAWPVKPGTRMVTAIRLTKALEDGFREGVYAHVEISYDAAAVAAAGLQSNDLTIAWWYGTEWNTNWGMIADSTIKNGKAFFATTDLHGIYAVVSAGRVCNSGALTVEPAGAKQYVDASTDILPPLPTIYTKVKSNIEFNNSNRDINPNEITAVLDGQTTIYADGTNPSTGFYTTTWDKITGMLVTKWNITAPRLTAGPHTLYVLAFNKSGFCAENTYTFTVDDVEPNVVVEGADLCTNPTFKVRVVDNGGAGVNWDSVYVDVYDITGSEFAVIPKSRLIFTESPDAYDDDTIPDHFDRATGTFTFQLVGHFAEGRRLKILVYDGVRDSWYNDDCSCEYYVYDHDFDGVPDLVGNHSEIVEELFTVWDCVVGPGESEVSITTTPPDNRNPFDPWQGEGIGFDVKVGGGVASSTPAMASVTANNSVTAKVYDIAGDEVASLVVDVSGTVGHARWNGRTDKGDFVAEGVYLVHFSTISTKAATMNQVVKVVVKRK